MRLAFDGSVAGDEAPTGVQRAAAVQRAALAALDPPPELLVFAPAGRRWPVAAWREIVLPGELRRARADLLVSPVAAVPLRAPCPVFATLHELPWAAGVPADAGGERSLAHRARTALAARVAARVICVSERTRAQFVALHPRAAAKAVVVPHGVDPRFSPGAVRSSAVPGRPWVLALGRLRRKKNLLALLAAFARTPAAADHVLVLAGPPGDASEALRARAAQPDLRGRVLLPGFVDDGRLLDLLRGARCLASVSRLEGFGLTALEAQACGTPVLASREGPVAESVGDAAEFCDARRPESIAAGLQAVLGAPRRQTELRAAGLAHAATRSAERSARALLAVCREALDERAAAGRAP